MSLRQGIEAFTNEYSLRLYKTTFDTKQITVYQVILPSNGNNKISTAIDVFDTLYLLLVEGLTEADNAVLEIYYGSGMEISAGIYADNTLETYKTNKQLAPYLRLAFYLQSGFLKYNAFAYAESLLDL